MVASHIPCGGGSWQPPSVVYIGACRVDLPLLKYQPSFWDSYLACKRCDLGYWSSLPLHYPLFLKRTDDYLWVISDVSCYNIENSLSLWDPNALCSIYSWWDCLDESFMMQSKANACDHWFLRYKQFSVCWLLIGWFLGGFLRCRGLPSIIGKVSSWGLSNAT